MYRVFTVASSYFQYFLYKTIKHEHKSSERYFGQMYQTHFGKSQHDTYFKRSYFCSQQTNRKLQNLHSFQYDIIMIIYRSNIVSFINICHYKYNKYIQHILSNINNNIHSRTHVFQFLHFVTQNDNIHTNLKQKKQWNKWTNRVISLVVINYYCLKTFNFRETEIF